MRENPLSQAISASLVMLTVRFRDKALFASVAKIRSNTDVYYSATQINIQVFVNHDVTQPTSQISVFS